MGHNRIGTGDLNGLTNSLPSSRYQPLSANQGKGQQLDRVPEEPRAKPHLVPEGAWTPQRLSWVIRREFKGVWARGMQATQEVGSVPRLTVKGRAGMGS